MTSKHSIFRATDGFNMIEVALALAIIAIGLIPIIGLMPSLLNSSRQSVDSSEVALAAQDYVERMNLYQLNPDKLALMPVKSSTQVKTSSFQANVLTTSDISINPSDGQKYTDASGGPLLKTVWITYSWPIGAAKPQTFTFVTEIAAQKNISISR